MLLTGSLPNELDHLYITLIHGRDKLSFEEVCSVLLDYEIWNKDKKKTFRSVNGSIDSERE